MKKRIATLLLAAILCMSLIPSAFAANIKGFVDVDSASWYAEAVTYAVEHGMVAGTSATTFSPQDTMTRAQFVTILSRMDGVKDSDIFPSAGYTDVPEGQYYVMPINWACKNSIVDVTGAAFRPNDNITREEMVIIMGKYLAYKGVTLPDDTAAPAAFNDAASISSAAKPYADILLKCGLVAGDDKHNLNPKSNMTRAEGVTIFMRLSQKLEGASSTPTGNASFTTNYTKLDIQTGDWEDYTDGLTFYTITISNRDFTNMNIIPILYTVTSSDTSVVKVSSGGNIYGPVKMTQGATPKTATIIVTSVEDGTTVQIPVTVSYKAEANPVDEGYYLVDDAFVNAYSAEVLRLVNALRIENSASTLAYGFASQEAANYRSYELSIKFSHIGPNDSSITALQSEYGGAGEGFTQENIARYQLTAKTQNGNTYIHSTPENVAASMVSIWTNSSSHKTTMLRSFNTKMVVGLYAEGNYVYSAQWFSSK